MSKNINVYFVLSVTLFMLAVALPSQASDPTPSTDDKKVTEGDAKDKKTADADKSSADKEVMEYQLKKKPNHMVAVIKKMNDKESDKESDKEKAPNDHLPHDH